VDTAGKHAVISETTSRLRLHVVRCGWSI